MKVIDPGHVYDLQPLDGEEYIPLVFVKRKGSKYPGNSNSHPGTTTQEVIRAIMERTLYVDNQIGCWQNKVIFFLLFASLYLLELRHYSRHKLGFPPLYKDFWLQSTCKGCSHTKCDKRKCYGDRV